ncbi:hypothetical protein C8R44DRAFT_728718 [Mycena epipterygia]|nr:hypothetical protein C8R44DRAFT_728718 [Mycena epipterygia]
MYYGPLQACVSQQLPVTQLEVVILAFAVINVFTWSLLWAKPLDVEQPIMNGPLEDLQDAKPTILALNPEERFIGSVFSEIFRTLNRTHAEPGVRFLEVQFRLSGNWIKSIHDPNGASVNSSCSNLFEPVRIGPQKINNLRTLNRTWGSVQVRFRFGIGSEPSTGNTRAHSVYPTIILSRITGAS